MAIWQTKIIIKMAYQFFCLASQGWFYFTLKAQIQAAILYSLNVHDWCAVRLLSSYASYSFIMRDD